MTTCPPEGYSLERLIPMGDVLVLFGGLALFIIVVFGFFVWVAGR